VKDFDRAINKIDDIFRKHFDQRTGISVGIDGVAVDGLGFSISGLVLLPASCSLLLSVLS
jgi:hypothetical protein